MTQHFRTNFTAKLRILTFVIIFGFASPLAYASSSFSDWLCAWFEIACSNGGQEGPAGPGESPKWPNYGS